MFEDVLEDFNHLFFWDLSISVFIDLMVKLFCDILSFFLSVTSCNQSITHENFDLLFFEVAVMIEIVPTKNGLMNHFELLGSDWVGTSILDHYGIILSKIEFIYIGA